MTTYTAWDGNEYPLPTPEGWYLGTDDRWWPEGHGPGPAAAVPAPLAGMPPVDASPAAAPTDWAAAPETTIYSSPAPGTADPNALAAAPADDGGGGNGKTFLVLGAVLALLVALGAGAFLLLGSGDDDDAAPATTVFQTQLDDTNDAPATTVAGGDAPATTAALPAGKGSIDDPYAVGEAAVVQYTDTATGELRVWQVEVLSPARDLTQAVLDENQFNDPPAAGQQFVAASVRVTYVSGPAPASLFELTFKAIGPSGVVLTTFDPSCGVVPDALDTFAELFEGGAVEGNICWPATPADAGDLTMMVEVFLDDEVVHIDMGG